MFYIYKSKKLGAKLLFYWGIAFIFLCLGYLGDTVDFFVILLTEKNLGNPFGLHSILCFVWAPFYALFGGYVGAELLIPKKKWYIVGVFFILGVLYELFMFIDPIGSFIVVYPKTSGEDLLDVSVNSFSPFNVIQAILGLMIFTFLGVGFLIKSIQSKGVLRKKFLLLAIGIGIISILAIFDVSIALGNARAFIRLFLISGFWVMYLGIREEPERKVKPEKKIKVEESLFRITKRPDHITEEEVSLSKEKKICLVCKGKLERKMYICPECDTFYCQKCSDMLANSENACWVCNYPLDESKPVKPLKKEEAIEEIKPSELTQKKPKKELFEE